LFKKDDRTMQQNLQQAATRTSNTHVKLTDGQHSHLDGLLRDRLQWFKEKILAEIAAEERRDDEDDTPQSLKRGSRPAREWPLVGYASTLFLTWSPRMKAGGTGLELAHGQHLRTRTKPPRRSEHGRTWANFGGFVMPNCNAFGCELRKCLIINSAVREGFEPSVAFWATAL